MTAIERISTRITGWTGLLKKPVHPAPLAVFRILFGVLMFGSMIRLFLKGWVHDLYIAPQYHFSYYGFNWVSDLGEPGMYLLVGLVGLSALGIMLGLFYRISATLFFLSFTYLELIDKAYYLNHYYFISLVGFLLILLPAHCYFSLDLLRKPELKVTSIPSWVLLPVKLQLGLVYFYAGIAKLEYDWLIRAQPLSNWLGAYAYLPVVGWVMKSTVTAYLFSWFGAIYDLTVPFFLSMKRTRPFAYFFVIAFHLITAFLFPIGMFPYIMIALTLVFFPASVHRKALEWISDTFGRIGSAKHFAKQRTLSIPFIRKKVFIYGLSAYFILQVLIPWRFLLYPGELFWNEEGFRFSWRVMLMEKAGTAFFNVTDPKTGGTSEVSPSEYLTPFQEKMMAMKPDMILQFAHFLEEKFKEKGIQDPIVTVDSYVTLNSSGSRRFIDPEVDLSEKEQGFHHKEWIIPFERTKELKVYHANSVKP